VHAAAPGQNRFFRHALSKDVLEDPLAVSLARAVAAANGRARQEGIEIETSVVTVTESGDEAIFSGA
jgi:hypothetical protein